jgi:hypothetical protein
VGLNVYHLRILGLTVGICVVPTGDFDDGAKLKEGVSE